MFAQAERLTVAQLNDAHLRHALTYYVKEGGTRTTEVANYEAATAPLSDIFGRRQPTTPARRS